MPRTATGPEFALLTRRQVELELERLSRQGVAQATYLLNLVTEENYRDIWPYVQPLLGMIMESQQQGSRRILQGYFVGIALAIGIGVAARSRPDLTAATAYRNGLLPSGMPWARLINTVPFTVQHRVENGLSLREALARSKATVMVAVNSQAHAEQRLAATDVLRDTSRYSPTMQQLIAENRANPPSGNDDYWRPATTVRPVRYIRQPNPGACSWCLMQATRGAIFYSEQTARSSGHNNCKCLIFPEPAPGAWANKVLVSPEQLEGQVWKDVKRDVSYDLSSIAAKSEQVVRQVQPTLV
jgi:hypothetical protein